jgi:hypothetical protein
MVFFLFMVVYGAREEGEGTKCGGGGMKRNVVQ